MRCAQAQEHSITLNINVVLKATLVMSRPLVPDVIPRISAFRHIAGCTSAVVQGCEPLFYSVTHQLPTINPQREFQQP